VEVDQGKATIAAMGLTNIEIRQANILDVAKEKKEYDYIIAHGVFSWVPEVVQEAILKLCGSQLAPEGVAYISYNVYPGWKMREVIREMMLYHAGKLQDPKAKLAQGRAILEYARKINSADSAFGKLLAQETELAMKANDYYLFHDHMEENNRPCYFKDFAERSSKYGVAYLGEASLVDMAPQRFGGDIPETLAMLSNGNIIATEQYMDFFTNRMFRQTLLVKDTATEKVKRNLNGASPRHLHFVSSMARDALTDGALGIFKDANGRTLTVREPVMLAVADALVDAQPFSAGVDAMVALLRSRKVAPDATDDALAEAVGSQLLTLMLQGMVRTYYSPIVHPAVGDKPKAFSAARGVLGDAAVVNRVRSVPNVFHQISGVSDPQAALLALMDGTRTAAQLESAMIERFKDGSFTASQDGQPITDDAKLKDVVALFCANTARDFAATGLMHP
jgi:methyltransferase-like protein